MHRVTLGVMVLMSGLGTASLAAAPASDAVQAVYRPDVRFAEFSPLWREGWSWMEESGERVRYGGPTMPLGGYLYACFRNSSSKPVPEGGLGPHYWWVGDL